MHQPILYVPIAPSGAGKSTMLNRLREIHGDVPVFSYSWDTLRHNWYHPTLYDNAWARANNDKSFKAKVNEEFLFMIKQVAEQQGHLYLDNTNLTPRSRAWHLGIAKNAGYDTVAITFDVPLEQLIARQLSRPDKRVPASVVRDQYDRMTLPEPKEFNRVISSSDA